MKDNVAHLCTLSILAQAIAEISFINKVLNSGDVSPVLQSDDGGFYINTFWTARSMREKTVMQVSNALMLNPLAENKSNKGAGIGRPPKGAEFMKSLAKFDD